MTFLAADDDFISFRCKNFFCYNLFSFSLSFAGHILFDLCMYISSVGELCVLNERILLIFKLNWLTNGNWDGSTYLLASLGYNLWFEISSVTLLLP